MPSIGQAIDALDSHYLDWDHSINLGYYRTEVTCSCGESWWFGEHPGDPRNVDLWRDHRSQVLRAVLDA